MSNLGKFDKQPVEVEKYAIQYVQALGSTDELVNIVQSISDATTPGTVVRSDIAYFFDESENNVVLYAKDLVYLNEAAPVGTRLFVANATQFDQVQVFNGQINVADLFANGSVALVKTTQGWEVEASVQANLVTMPGDQRVRFTFYGGTNGQRYRVESTVTTQEGRVMQDEFQVRIREI